MSYLDIIDRVLEEQKKKAPQEWVDKAETSASFADISLMKLSELAKRNIAIEIYSEILGCEIWLCSNELMSLQVKEDHPEAITYTVDEIRELLRLNPTPEDIKRLHAAKSVFNGSRIVGEADWDTSYVQPVEQKAATKN